VPTELPAGGVNAVGRMLGALGDEWTLLLVRQAALGATRYGDFAARLPISHAVLSRRLKVMTADGLLTQRAYQDNPPRSEYLLTARGRALWPMLTTIWEWERHWVPDHAEHLPAMLHLTCGAHFAPLMTCRACGETCSEKELHAMWGPSGSWPRSMPVESTRRRPSGLSAPHVRGSDAKGAAGLFPETMNILGNRWAFALLVAAFVGTTRFSDFQRQLGASPGSLTDRLQIFTGCGVLSLEKGHYRLTEKGRAVLPVLVTALQWAQRWHVSPEGPAVTLTHTGCGAPFEAVLTCDQCTEVLHGSDIRADPTLD
jgi:DNA-binding HxlR family transcriptional regulator